VLKWTRTWPDSESDDDFSGRGLRHEHIRARIYRMGGGGREVGWAWSIVDGDRPIGSGRADSAAEAAGKAVEAYLRARAATLPLLTNQAQTDVIKGVWESSSLRTVRGTNLRSRHFPPDEDVA